MATSKFFASPQEIYGNALINWMDSPTKELLEYAGSYRGAAMNLVAFRERLSEGFHTIDHSALPILFLYRHSLELYLKSLVFRAAILSVNEKELANALPRLWREHSLRALVNMAKPLFEASAFRSPYADIELQERLQDTAKRIDDVDPGSYAFRYPVTSQGNASLPQNFLTNIFLFSEYIEPILDELKRFCVHLENERIKTSKQMKLALHPITNASPEKKKMA